MSSDNYVVDIYYDSYYEPVKWSDLTTAQKVAAGLAILTLDPLTIGIVAGIASPWWVNRANIGFGLSISTMDTNDGSDYHITPINVTYDSGSGLSALAQYVDYIDFYSNKEQTGTFRVYTNALMQYRFPWNSMYQEWTDSGSGGFIHYGTNLQQYDTFYDDTFHDVSSSQPNSRDGIVMNAGIRINPNGAPSGAPKLTVVERGAYQVDSFTEFYGIAKIGFKEQYLKYQLRNSGMSAEYDVNYRHHYEPKYAHRTPGGDYYDDFSY